MQADADLVLALSPAGSFLFITSTPWTTLSLELLMDQYTATLAAEQITATLQPAIYNATLE